MINLFLSKKNQWFWLIVCVFSQSFASPSIAQTIAEKVLLQNHENERSLFSQINTQTLARQLADSYTSKQVLTEFPSNLSLEKANTIQAQFLQLIQPYWGKVIGYKAGLTNQIAQEKFKVSHPVLGVFLEKMLLPSGSKVPANFGARPMFEGDLIVRVSSDKINQAKTPQEVLESLDAVIPFIELPDLVYAKEMPLNGSMLVAINVGARLGVVGEPIAMKANQEWENRLGNIQLTILDKSKKPLATGESKALLGHPLNVVLWIRDTLKAQGKELKKGDLLSLGTITPLMPIPSQKTIYARYTGLDPDRAVEISVHFE